MPIYTCKYLLLKQNYLKQESKNWMAKQKMQHGSAINRPVVTLLNMIVSAMRPPSSMHICSNSCKAINRSITPAKFCNFEAAK